MNYKQITVKTNDAPQREILIALLASMGFDGFEEKENELLAFIAEDNFDTVVVENCLASFSVTFSAETIEKTNWNKSWEQNFQPVVVDGFCTVRADFHNMSVHTPHEIIITPKMSFGTGHHATTQLMMRMMQHISFEEKTVFDFGTGTGILAILAAQLRAKNIIAIDNDEWSFENAVENASRNNADIDVRLSTLEDVPESHFDIILANINRHILLQYMTTLYEKAALNGIVLMSGLLQEDKEIVVASAERTGFLFEKMEQEQNWIALQFSKRNNVS